MSAATNVAMNADGLAGLRVLVVEDETVIAVLIEEALLELGCIVIGPVGKLDAALRLADSEQLDGAILDVTIRGGNVYPVAHRLAARGIWFVLASGYGNWALPKSLQGQHRLTKPFTRRELEATVRLLCHAGA